MGAWGHGLLQNDDAPDGLLSFVDSIAGDIARLLMESEELQNLKHLDLRGSELGNSVRSALRKRWPFVLIG